LVLALMLERLGYYGFRAEFVLVEQARGVENQTSSQLLRMLSFLVLIVPAFFAVVAIVIPRVWVGLGGAGLGALGLGLAVMGPQENLATALVIFATGTGAVKACLAVAAAEFVDSVRARLVVLFVGYGAANLAGFIAPFSLSPETTESFSRVPLFAMVGALVLIALSAALSRVFPALPDVDRTVGPWGLTWLLTAPGILLLWVVSEGQVQPGAPPIWFFGLNPIAMSAGTMVLAPLFALVPERLLRSLTMAALVAGLPIVAVAASGVVSPPDELRVLAGAQGALALAELCLVAFAMTLTVSLAPARLAPLSLAATALYASVSNRTGAWPISWRLGAIAGLLVLSVLSTAVLGIFRKTTLAPLTPTAP
ncbi:MAG: hypothetical protein Q8N26_24895, partial [Myxococcales bacterium]|nr:hypothetical protein [Myxococcales bacterium]